MIKRLGMLKTSIRYFASLLEHESVKLAGFGYLVCLYVVSSLNSHLILSGGLENWLLLEMERPSRFMKAYLKRLWSKLETTLDEYVDNAQDPGLDELRSQGRYRKILSILTNHQ